MDIFEQDSLTKGSPEEMATIGALCQRQWDQSLVVANLELSLKTAKEELKLLADNLVPDAMQSANMKKLQLMNGAEISVNPYVECNIPTETAIAKTLDEDEKLALITRRKNCFKFIRDQGADGIIKNLMTLDLGKVEAEEMALIHECLDSSLEVINSTINKTYTLDQTESVHSQTLKSWIKEIMQIGEQKVPETDFAVFSGNRAKITLPKKAK